MAKKIIKKQKETKVAADQVKKGTQCMVGRVVSAKTPKTAVVLVESRKVHPLYGKAYKRSARYLVHDEIKVSEGDVVEIVKTRPMSKNKHFMIMRVLGKDIEAIVTEQLKEDAAAEIAGVMPEEKEESKDKGQEPSENEPEEKVEKIKKKTKKEVKD